MSKKSKKQILITNVLGLQVALYDRKAWVESPRIHYSIKDYNKAKYYFERQIKRGLELLKNI
jgi:hypothetical protein